MIIIVSSNELNEMKSYKRLTDNEKERREMKFEYLDSITSAVKKRWNKATKVVRVLDEILFKATDRGFSFNGRETLAEKCDCSLWTVDEAFRVLREWGRAVIAYRENPNSNGYKTPVVILKDHPYFKYWNELLELDLEVDLEVENGETPCESKDKEQENVPTYLLPSSLKPIYRYIDDIRTTQHNEQSIKSIVINFRQATKDKLNKRSFMSIVRKVIDKYNQGKVMSFRDYLATALANKISELEHRRLADKTKRELRQQRQYREPKITPNFKNIYYNWQES